MSEIKKAVRFNDLPKWMQENSDLNILSSRSNRLDVDAEETFNGSFISANPVVNIDHIKYGDVENPTKAVLLSVPMKLTTKDGKETLYEAVGVNSAMESLMENKDTKGTFGVSGIGVETRASKDRDDDDNRSTYDRYSFHMDAFHKTDAKETE